MNAGTARHAATTASPPARSVTVALSLGLRERVIDPQAVLPSVGATAEVEEVLPEVEAAAAAAAT